MSRLFLTFYGDDFTGSTDALEQLSLAGIRTALFIEPPSPKRLARHKGLQALGVAGMTRSMSPDLMETELRAAFKKLRAMGARHVHYKVCSTFDSSPKTGSIGRAVDVGADMFRAPFVPVLAAAPGLGRFTVFGNHFARYGIGIEGPIYRLDTHPSISRHPVTPMTEADLRLHLEKQTARRISLFDILNVGRPFEEARKALARLITSERPGVIIFDALTSGHLDTIGRLLNGYTRKSHPLFSVGSSGVESALSPLWNRRGRGASVLKGNARLVPQLLVGSGSCSPVTAAQIGYALQHGFAEVPLDPSTFVTPGAAAQREVNRAVQRVVKELHAGRSVVVHTTRSGASSKVQKRMGSNTASVLGTALGQVLRRVLEASDVQRLCICGGDTSSYAARALGIESVEMMARLSPGAPICRATAPGSPADDLEVVFKGGQLGANNYFEQVRKGKL